MLDVAQIDCCRACYANDLNFEPILSLGNLAISGFPLPGEPPLERAPLTLVRCGVCGLVQLLHTVPRGYLYGDTYWYRSGVNETMVAALRDIVEDAISCVDLKPSDHVLDIASNDGTLLRQYPQWVTRIGFDPAENLFHEASVGGNTIFLDYYPPLYRCSFQAKIITSIAMFYDLDDPNAFVAAIKKHLHPEGVWIVQFQDLDAMVNSGGIDNIVHEHVTYWDWGTFERLINVHKLESQYLSFNRVNGGSMRVVVGHEGTRRHPINMGVRVRGELATFAGRAEKNKQECLTLLHDLKTQGAHIYGYAASTKFNTLSQFYQIGSDLITAMADRSPQKWGRLTATGIPIISEDEMRVARPTHLFCGAWPFADAFAERERVLLDSGTQMIVPLPTLRVISSERVAAPV